MMNTVMYCKMNLMNLDYRDSENRHYKYSESLHLQVKSNAFVKKKSSIKGFLTYFLFALTSISNITVYVYISVISYLSLYTLTSYALSLEIHIPILQRSN